MTPHQLTYLRFGVKGWFAPSGRGWRTCDGLVRRGLMEHNGMERFKGEAYRTTSTGLAVLEPTTHHATTQPERP